MLAWKIVAGPRSYEPSSSDSERGWAWDIQRDGDKRTVRVEVAGTLDASDTDLPDDARQAIRTSGQSAVRAILNDADPPERLTVTTHGVHAA